uniref:Uncharacterized protein n=1 Tax=Schistosoma haematobium TaxID=6185 RepID=A0A095A133_SCHHA
MTSKVSRLSSLVINSDPVYLKSESRIVYSSDKFVVVLDTRTGVSQFLHGHRDSVVWIVPGIDKPHHVISGGLDGKLIVWDTKTFEKVQSDKKVDLSFKIRCLYG